MSGARIVKIAGAAGMWGDSVTSTQQLLAVEGLDYLMYETLAEITMGIMTKARLKSPDLGYAVDVIEPGLTRYLKAFKAKGVKVITNAGGVNPAAAVAVLRRAATEQDLDLKIATVTGDDLMPQLDKLRADGITEMSSGGALPDKLVSLNAYLGAGPIVAALDAGADIVVTGRVVDSALALAPLIHEFGWAWDDFDKLAAGSLVGHLLECGPQSTGGLLTDWDSYDGWARMGFPVAECRADGDFVLTKPQGTGGIVNRASATEQLLYEIGDPAAYILPDVVCDFTSVHVNELAPDRVAITGAKGRAPTPTLKACGQEFDGYRTQFLCSIGGRDAVAKAERLGRDVLARIGVILKVMGLAPFRDTSVEVLGGESTYGPHSRARDAREVILKIAVSHEAKDALAVFAREVPSFGLGGPQGLSGGGAGRARPTPLIRLHAYLIPRAAVVPQVEIDDTDVPVSVPPLTYAVPTPRAGETAPAPSEAADPVEVPLIALAFGRSGDKGDIANIGIAARHADFLPTVSEQVTPDRVAAYMAHLGLGRVDRYALPGTMAFNFVLQAALGGGGTASLRFDPQGKALAQMLLDLPVRMPRALLDHAALKPIPEVAALTAAARD